MVYLYLLQLHRKSHHIASIPLSIGLFVSISVLVALCAKHSKKLKKLHSNDPIDSRDGDDLAMIPPRSPLRFPKQLISSIGDKALPLIYHHRGKSDVNGGKDDDVEKAKKAADGGGEGLWRKAILMGEKCQPPEFSGAIYYDYEGNRISEMPRSPRVHFSVGQIKPA